MGGATLEMNNGLPCQYVNFLFLTCSSASNMVAWQGWTVSIARARKTIRNVSYPSCHFGSVDFSNFTDLERSCTDARSGQIYPVIGEPCTSFHSNATTEVEWEATLDGAQSSLCSQRHWERWCVQFSEGVAESAWWKDPPLASNVCRRCFKMFVEWGEYITNHYVLLFFCIKYIHSDITYQPVWQEMLMFLSAINVLLCIYTGSEDSSPVPICERHA